MKNGFATWIYGLFLYLSCILLGLSCQKILSKMQASKRHKKVQKDIKRGEWLAL